MLRYALRNLLARKARLGMSLLSIALGVAFLAGVLTFDHGLRHTFDNILDGSTPDAVVRVAGADQTSGQATTATLTPEDVARLAALPEAAAAYGNVVGHGVSLVGHDGRLVGGNGAPTLAFNRTASRNLLGEPIMQLQQGHWPQGPRDLTMDARAADRAGYRIGDEVTLVVPTSALVAHLRLVGTATFTGGGTAGAILLLVSTQGAQQLFLGGRDAYSSVDLAAAAGTSPDQLVTAARRVLPSGFEAVTGKQAVDEAQDSIGAVLGAVTTFFLVFAGIAVIVCGLLILNTFTILVAQRTRELAVLRALGASRAQVSRSVLIEASVLACVATMLGVVGGWGLARGLAAAFAALGLEIAGSALTLTTSTVVLCAVVGITGTVVAAYVPARRAGRVPPVAAMQVTAPTGAGTRQRLLIAGALLAVGVLAATAGLTGVWGHRSLWVGGAGVVWIVALATSCGTVGRPLLALLREAFTRLFGVTGQLGGQNALRDSRRTGATASALMIGMAVVSTISILAASLNRSVDDLVDQNFAADFIVTSPAYTPFPTSIGDRLATVEGVGLVVRQQVAQATLDGRSVMIDGNDASFDRIYRLDILAGTPRLDAGQALVDSDTARAHGWRVGSGFTVQFPGLHVLRLHVAGIARTSQVTAPISVPIDDLAAAGVARQDSAVSILLAPGADAHAVHQRLDAAIADVPVVSVQDKAQYAAAIHGQVNQLLYLIYGLLALAVIIAVLGIVNTLGLSVVERTRELGLLRAVGVSRVQLRAMITLESVATALLGAALGVVVGLATGVLLRQALSDDITSLDVPVWQLLVFLAGSVAAGVLAATVPAVRASRLDVLQAIATE
ncbi:ABC transporter permease [Nocardioides nematodiphilus]|uniref:ABC transporter permease n=1 Tax=Nocardioides nematodiphilus TaxID=2849669 RepID=UPI001CD9B3F0|nr:FtsX-like permease family protein [Nocardioides nematodiphilus]MCA1981871.1 FtsX-like permease family protein [Nocardioides nematodiphilus]